MGRVSLAPAPVPEFLCFTSWWRENEKGQSVRREVKLSYDTKDGSMTLCLNKVTSMQYRLSHVDGKYGPVEPCDLFVGAQLKVLGRVLTLRQADSPTVRWLEAAAPDSVWSSRLFLIGSSEGGMVASRFYDEALHARLSGLVLLQWSCEYNYYVPCARDAIICEGKCRASLPVLAMVAAQDPFFSATNADSVAATVARAAGYSLSGDCAAQLARQQTDAVSIVLPQHGTAEHGLTEAAPNLIRALLADFLHTPHLVTAMPTLRPEARLCRRGESEAMHARWSCVELGSEPLRPLDKDLPCSSWNTLYHAEYHGGLPPSSSTLQDGLQACSTLWQRPDEFERVAE